MNDRLIKDYRPYLAKLSELSYDREHKVSLIEDEDMSHRMFNFDGISDKFSEKIRGEKNMSCDGYYEKTSQDTYLVEFKNREEGKIDKKWLKNKIYDSIATVVMNENVTRTDVAGRVTVIIVYNDANHGEKTDSDYSTSEAFNRFSEKLGELSGRKDVDSLPKKFDLERYKGILFKDVYTVDRRNFEKYFLKILLSRKSEMRVSDMEKDPFKKYLKESEPDKASKGYAWSTAIGLQAVDGLRPSRYLIDTAIQNIEGKITLKEAQNLINSYYEERPVHVSADERTEEADKVSSRIAEILSENAFSFSPNEYISIHHRLFKGIYKHAGKIRDYNITKKEWVLDGASVIYGSASELRSTLEYDFLQERGYSYKGLSMDEIIHHFAVFVSRLWQIHIFGEGNTRTTAVFFIKYLRTLGFSVTNSIFAENAWYFRNALVRANYTDLQKGVHETTEYLEVFLRNLLLNEKNELHNRSLHISGLWDDKKVDIGDGKVDIETRKVDIEIGKVDIETPKVDITHTVAGKAIDFSARTLTHIDILFEKFGYDKIFGRSAIMDTLELKSSGASKLISNLLQADIIEPVSGHGKGKYKFKE